MDGLFNEKQKTILKVCVIIAAVYLGMKYVVPVFIPFLIAGILSLLLLPAVNWLHKRLRINKSFSAACLMLSAGILLLGLMWLLFGQLFLQVENLLYYCDSYGEDLKRNLSSICCEMEGLIGIDAIEIETLVIDNITILIESVKTEKLPKLMGNSLLLLKKTVSIFAMVIVTFISVLLIIKDYKKMQERFCDNPYCRKCCEIVKKILAAAGTYLKAQLTIMGLISALCVITMFFMKNPYALLIGILIGLFDALPFIGTGTILVPWAVIEVFLGSYKEAAILFILFLVCSFLREMLEPRLIGKRLGVYPIVVLTSIYVGIRLFGIGGIVLGPVSVLIIYELTISLTNQAK